MKCITEFKVLNQILLNPENKSLNKEKFKELNPNLLVEYIFVIPIIEEKEGTAATSFANHVRICKFDKSSLLKFLTNIYKEGT